MKRLFRVCLVACLAMAACGCIVTSIYPFYSDDTVVFDPALLGKWSDDDGKETWTFAKEGERAYRVQVIERKAGPAGDKAETQASTYVVHLFRLGGSRFLDVFPANVTDLSVGTHFLARIDLRDGTLTARALDLDAVDRVMDASGPLHLHVRDDGTVSETGGGPGLAGTLFAAPTPHLQSFLEQHGTEIFEKNGGVMRKVARTDAVGR